MCIRDRRRTAVRNRSYFALNTVLKSRLVTQSIKLRLYKTLIRPVVACGGKTWSPDRSAMELLDRFQTNLPLLRRIIGVTLDMTA